MNPHKTMHVKMTPPNIDYLGQRLDCSFELSLSVSDANTIRDAHCKLLPVFAEFARIVSELTRPEATNDNPD
jgi:hypothetical protein